MVDKLQTPACCLLPHLMNKKKGEDPSLLIISLHSKELRKLDAKKTYPTLKNTCSVVGLVRPFVLETHKFHKWKSTTDYGPPIPSVQNPLLRSEIILNDETLQDHIYPQTHVIHDWSFYFGELYFSSYPHALLYLHLSLFYD